MKKSILIKEKLCSSEDPVTRVTLALHRHIIAFWNLDDPKNENLQLAFELKAQLVFCTNTLRHLISAVHIYIVIIPRIKTDSTGPMYGIFK